MADKFIPNEAYHLQYRHSNDGGMVLNGNTMVSCDLDYQPHCLDSHTTQQGRATPCSRPVRWTTGGLNADKDMDL